MKHLTFVIEHFPEEGTTKITCTIKGQVRAFKRAIFIDNPEILGEWIQSIIEDARYLPRVYDGELVPHTSELPKEKDDDKDRSPKLYKGSGHRIKSGYWQIRSS